MSKGPGKWQRLILAELERQEAFYLIEVLPRPRRRSDYVAAQRAMIALEDAHKLTVQRYYCGHSRSLIVRIGAQVDRLEFDRQRWEAAKLSGDRVRMLELINS